MRSLWFLLLQSAFYADASFGTPFFKSPNSELCHPWNCVNNKLGLPSTLPPREQLSVTLKSLLPPGAWQDVVETVVDTCYNDRPRSYVSTCPGQAILHCTVDNLIQNCPVHSWRKDDGCYPVSSLAGTKNMFTQSRYHNLEKNMPHELRPAWFLRNYFNSKCCDLPDFINSTIVSECGFSTFIRYYDHKPNMDDLVQNTIFVKSPRTTSKPTAERIDDVNNGYTTVKPTADDGDNLNIIPLPDEKDPLNCCDMDDFIQPGWLQECGFHLSWDREKRLTINEDLAPSTTVPPPTTHAPVNKDVRVVPLSCKEESCVFENLNIINSTSESIDTEAFTKLLDNFTAAHPEWEKAKARVLTQCVERAKQGYRWECPINMLLTCTLDVLSENCPYANKQRDTCRHSRRNNTVCQVSSSMYRPKNRRAVCGLPNLVNNVEVLAQCGVTSISRTEFVADPPVPKKEKGWSQDYGCKATTPPALCLLNKMGVLNKYGFVEYFKMLERVNSFPKRRSDWSILVDAYVFIFNYMPMYREHCNSTKNLLNVLDVMLMTCPASKRKNTAQCKSLLNDMITAPINGVIPKDKLDQIVQRFNMSFVRWISETPKPSTETATTVSDIKTNPPFDFALNSNVPPAKTINVKKSKEIKVILPVYMRTRNSLSMDTSSLNNYKDGVFNSAPFLLHEKIPLTNPVKTTPIVLP